NKREDEEICLIQVTKYSFSTKNNFSSINLEGVFLLLFNLNFVEITKILSHEFMFNYSFRDNNLHPLQTKDNWHSINKWWSFRPNDNKNLNLGHFIGFLITTEENSTDIEDENQKMALDSKKRMKVKGKTHL
ncbi:hypothetical protein ACJX0J_037995, partial [Zea mays]